MGMLGQSVRKRKIFHVALQVRSSSTLHNHSNQLYQQQKRHTLRWQKYSFLIKTGTRSFLTCFVLGTAFPQKEEVELDIDLSAQ